MTSWYQSSKIVRTGIRERSRGRSAAIDDSVGGDRCRAGPLQGSRLVTPLLALAARKTQNTRTLCGRKIS